MVDRYVALARSPRRVRSDYEDDFGGPHRTLTVFEDNDAVETGLYDANGVPLYRVPDRVKMGFRSE